MLQKHATFQTLGRILQSITFLAAFLLQHDIREECQHYLYRLDRRFERLGPAEENIETTLDKACNATVKPTIARAPSGLDTALCGHDTGTHQFVLGFKVLFCF